MLMLQGFIQDSKLSALCSQFWKKKKKNNVQNWDFFKGLIFRGILSIFLCSGPVISDIQFTPTKP